MRSKVYIYPGICLPMPRYVGLPGYMPPYASLLPGYMPPYVLFVGGICLPNTLYMPPCLPVCTPCTCLPVCTGLSGAP